MKLSTGTALALVLIASSAADALRAPPQANVATAMPAENGQTRELFAELEGGSADMLAQVTNREDSRTAKVLLRFSYRVPPDTIALDEIIDRIVVEVRTTDGERFGRATIDPNDINLNPNASTLSYKLTLYRPEGAYRVRVRVFGNYE